MMNLFIKVQIIVMFFISHVMLNFKSILMKKQTHLIFWWLYGNMNGRC